MIAYNINQITFISFQKLTTKSFNTIEKINDRNPIIYNVLISGDKKIPRYLVCNKANDMLMIWTKSSQSEVFPWRPTVKDQDRANLHIYLLSPMKIELLSYYWTENDPICLEFSIHGNNQINIVEQKISKKGEVTIESSIYQVQKLKLQRQSITTIPIQTQICCSAYSPDQEKLLVGCIDGSILLFDSERGVTHMVKAAFVSIRRILS
jgi:WD repeat-containing and planar cell polarity effector protein